MRPRYVLTAREMAEVDRYTIEELGIPGAVLMEQAGKAVAERCIRLLAGCPHPRIVVICGRGNNGGDGFVAARWLVRTYTHVQVILLGEADRVKGDARLNLEIWRKLGHAVLSFNEKALHLIAESDLIVDAMLGTGARGELKNEFKKAATAINECNAEVVAVDIPTGVDASTGQCDANAVRATATVTFGSLKFGHVFSPGFDHAGEVTLVDIGFPDMAFQQINPRTFWLDSAQVQEWLPTRHRTDFKNRCGQVYVVAGSRGMGGAAYLTSRAAIRVGAGLVILGTPATVAEQLEGRLIEVIKEPLPEKEGMLQARAWDAIAQRLNWADAIAVGPGLGTGEEVQTLIKNLISRYSGILVIDADGINLLKGHPEVLKRSGASIILTPHPGEFSRLTGVAKEAILADPVGYARDFAGEYGCYLLLKGAPSVAASPDGEVYINSVGNPGMATAGMGDVLTGTIAGLAGQLKAAKPAMLVGMFVHSLAGDLACRHYGELSLNAGDVLNTLPEAFQTLRHPEGETDRA